MTEAILSKGKVRKFEIPAQTAASEWLKGFQKSSNDLRKLASTCVEWPNETQVGRTCVQNLNMFKSNASRRKSSQVNASGWPNGMQVSASNKTCDDLR